MLTFWLTCGMVALLTATLIAKSEGEEMPPHAIVGSLAFGILSLVASVFSMILIAVLGDSEEDEEDELD